MSKICIQCSQKIGFFKSPIEGVYCSYDCRNDARAEIERAQSENLALEAAARRQAEQEAEERRRSETVLKAEFAKASHCPKCEKPWSLVQGGGAMGLDVGDCASCGFSSEFLRVDKCPNCHSDSLVIQSGETGKCPRCKYKTGYTRLTA